MPLALPIERRLVQPVGPLRGRLTASPDKSLSHRFALFSALAPGRSEAQGFLEGADCLASLAAVQQLGVGVERLGPGHYACHSPGHGGLQEAAEVIDCGNSGTTMRLLAGLLAGLPGHAVLTGDASLRQRPMARIVEPLRRMGARVDGREGGRLAPLAIRGASSLQGIEHRSSVASAQVKSALLLAGLGADGPTRVWEPQRSRDHTERMLQAMGARLRVEGLWTHLEPGAPLAPFSGRLAGDPSSVAFWMVAACIVPGSELVLDHVGLNPTRRGLLDALVAMGGDLEVRPQGQSAGEEVGEVRVRHAPLRGIELPPEEVPRMVDELPIFAVAAAFAAGTTRVRGAGELRVKESDRLAALSERLALPVRLVEDGFELEGRPGGPAPWPEGPATSQGDHRLAMALSVLALAGDRPRWVEDTACVATSYPGFWGDLATVAPEEGQARLELGA